MEERAGGHAQMERQTEGQGTVGEQVEGQCIDAGALTVINDKQLGRHTPIMQALQSVHDTLGRHSPVESVPGAPAKDI